VVGAVGESGVAPVFGARGRGQNGAIRKRMGPEKLLSHRTGCYRYFFEAELRNSFASNGAAGRARDRTRGATDDDTAFFRNASSSGGACRRRDSPALLGAQASACLNPFFDSTVSCSTEKHG